MDAISDSKVHGANIGPNWVLPAPDGPHVGPMNLVIRDEIAITVISFLGLLMTIYSIGRAIDEA